MRKKVLILCTGNSCRSIMAEGLINHLLADQWVAYSAGTAPSFVNNRAIEVMREIDIDISDYYSKSVLEFQHRDDIDLVITVCDDAHENCPIFSKPIKQLHIPIPDPASFSDSPDEVALPRFRMTRDLLKEKIIPLLQEITC